MVDVTAKLLKAFPGWSREQNEILMERFAENNFTDERMMDAVNSVIDTYQGYGKLPNIANFIQFDKCYEAYTMQQKNQVVYDKKFQDSDFAIVRIEGISACRSAGRKTLFVLKSDIERYRLKTREPIYAGQEWTD
ncbi:MAG: hypothetical protein HGA87_01390 [Desulfobulbaceae bacterium]|nr:hypothetical protein [Desulfobulbaceae bacterium]